MAINIYPNPIPVKLNGYSEQNKFSNGTITITDSFGTSEMPQAHNNFVYNSLKHLMKLTDNNKFNQFTRILSLNLIETISQTILDNEFKDYPDIIKPKLVVIDSLQFATEEEIKKELNIPSDVDIFANSKKKPYEMTRMEFIEQLSKTTGLSEEIINQHMRTNGVDKACYSAKDNTIIYYADTLRFNKEDIQKTIKHESYHAQQAILRSSIPQKDRDFIVKEELLNRLLGPKQEYKYVFKRYPENGILNNTIMEVPYLGTPAKKNLFNIANNYLFADDWSLYEKMQKYSELLEQENPDKTKLKKTKAALGGLAEQIEELASKSDTFADIKLCFKRSKEKNKILFDYLMSFETRYQYYRQKEIPNIPETHQADEKTKIAFSYNIDTEVSTFVMKKNNNKQNWTIYYTSPEEVKANVYSNNKFVSKKIDLYNKFYEAEQKYNENPNLKNNINYYCLLLLKAIDSPKSLSSIERNKLFNNFSFLLLVCNFTKLQILLPTKVKYFFMNLIKQ